MKRLIAMLLIGLFSFAAGCGGKKEPTTPPADEAATTAPADDAAAPAGDEAAAPAGDAAAPAGDEAAAPAAE